VSATFREVDETVERELFERRARALPAGGVPSLEAVLLAANEGVSVAVPARPPRDQWRERSVARARAWSGFALAAACVVAVMRTSPPAAVPVKIAPDARAAADVVMASAPFSHDTCEEAEENACTLDRTSASVTPVAPLPPVPKVTPAAAPVPEEGTCGAPLATFEPASSSTLSCESAEPGPSELH
jgi:hypothetical protein